MNLDELIQLTRDYEETILTHRMSKAEVVMFLALLKERVMAKVVGGVASPKHPAPVKVEEEKVVNEPEKRSIKYDPVYDPAPQVNIETPPPLPVATDRILAQKNFACVCNACTKVAYIVNRDIKDGCKIDFFLESYTPMDGVKPLTKSIEIQNIDGQISTDCPICGANKSLYLTGKKDIPHDYTYRI